MSADVFKEGKKKKKIYRREFFFFFFSCLSIKFSFVFDRSAASGSRTGCTYLELTLTADNDVAMFRVAVFVLVPNIVWLTGQACRSFRCSLMCPVVCEWSQGKKKKKRKREKHAWGRFRTGCVWTQFIQTLLFAAEEKRHSPLRKASLSPRCLNDAD